MLAVPELVYDLPGESARASLKLQLRPSFGIVLRAWANLPGESARASLKQASEVCGAGEVTGSPGRNGPGLIEAWPSEAGRRRTASPGRIGPGLIEAARSSRG